MDRETIEWRRFVGGCIVISAAMIGTIAWKAQSNTPWPPLPAGAPPYCGTIQGTNCTARPDAVLGRMDNGTICRWVKANPQWEHTVARFHDKLHCQLLGGRNVKFGDCRAYGGPLTYGTPNLKAQLEPETITDDARRCSQATGWKVPAHMLVEYAEDHQQTFHMGLCKWDGYPWRGSFPAGVDPDKTSGVLGQQDVPAPCLGWNL